MILAYKNVYFDKNGTEIKAGMFMCHDDDQTIELVYACQDDNGVPDLGFNASNEAYMKRHGTGREVYPLHQFNLKEWVIVNEKI